MEIQENEDVDLTGSAQHGLKKRSTTSLSLTIQTIIAQALDGDNYAIMASLDLSAAFDEVNINLLLNNIHFTDKFREMLLITMTD